MINQSTKDISANIEELSATSEDINSSIREINSNLINEPSSNTDDVHNISNKI